MYKFLNRLIEGLKRLAGKHEQSAKLPTYIGGYIPPSAAYGRCGEKAKFRDHTPAELDRYRKGLGILLSKPSATIGVEEYLGAAEHGPNRDWSIQVFQNRIDDDGAKARSCTIFQCEAVDIGEAYAYAQGQFPEGKLGAILPGKHLRF
jgi:hypothetical protein